MFRKLRDNAAAAKAKRQEKKDKLMLTDKLLKAAYKNDLDAALEVIQHKDCDLSVINWARKHAVYKTKDGEDFQSYGPNALFFAAYKGSLAVLNALLAVDGVDVNAEAEGFQGETPLLAAIVYKKKDCAMALAECPKVDPSFNTTVYGDNAVFVAGEYMPELLPLLVKHPKFDPRIRNTSNETPLHMLCRFKGDGSKEHQASIVDVINHPQTEIDARDYQGYSPLMRAAEHGKTNACKRLLDKGANKTLTNATYCDAATLANYNGHKELCEMIRNYQPQADRSGMLVTGIFSCEELRNAKEVKLVGNAPSLR